MYKHLPCVYSHIFFPVLHQGREMDCEYSPSTFRNCVGSKYHRSKKSCITTRATNIVWPYLNDRAILYTLFEAFLKSKNLKHRGS